MRETDEKQRKYEKIKPTKIYNVIYEPIFRVDFDYQIEIQVRSYDSNEIAPALTPEGGSSPVEPYTYGVLTL